MKREENETKKKKKKKKNDLFASLNGWIECSGKIWIIKKTPIAFANHDE